MTFRPGRLRACLNDRRTFCKILAAALPVLQAQATFLRTARAQAAATPLNTRIDRRGGVKRVLILGAGLSGLVAGYELMLAGHDVTILEGRTRPGGRVHTLRTPFSDGFSAEAGAGRIPIDHHWTHAYISQFGLTTVPLTPPSLAPVLFHKGQRIPITPTTPYARYFELSAGDRKLSPDEMAAKYLVPVIKEVLAAGDIDAADWPPASLRKFGKYKFFELFDRQGASPGVAQILFSGPIPEVSALWGLRILAHTDFQNFEKIAGGNDLLPKAIASQLGERIHYGARVVRFDEETAGVSATFIQDGTHHTLGADYLICALPFSVLRELEALPPLSALKQQAIREMSYGSVVKVVVESETRSWERRGFSGFAKTDSLSEIWSPDWDHPSKRGLLQLYQEGPLAAEFDRMTPDAVLKRGAAQIQAVFPEFLPDFARSTSYSWQTDEFARGAYGLVEPGQFYSWYPGAGTPEGRIHFAGEHLSGTPAFMQGAIQSGHGAAVAVNARS
jgi:monoamine oxidase